MPSGHESGRVNALRSRLKRREGSVHYPRAPTQKPSNKERAPTQEPAGALKTQRVTAQVSGLCSVLAGCAGFFFSGALLPARSWLPRVGSCVPGPFRRLALAPVSRCVVSRPGCGQKVWCLLQVHPGTLWPTWYGSILSLTRYWSGSAMYCLGYDFSAFFPMVYLVRVIGYVDHTGVAKRSTNVRVGFTPIEKPKKTVNAPKFRYIVVIVGGSIRGSIIPARSL